MLCLRQTCINPYIQPSLVVMETSMKYKSEPKRWIKSRRQALLRTGRIKKVTAITPAKNNKKSKTNYTGSETLSLCPILMNIATLKNTWITLPMTSLKPMSMSSHQKVKSWNSHKAVLQSTLLITSIPVLVIHALAHSSMV